MREIRPSRFRFRSVRLERQGGLSLIELIAGMAILSVALAGIYGVVSQAIRSFGVSEDFLEVQQNARVALGKLADEAKWSQGVSPDTPACPWPTCAELTIPPDNPMNDPPRGYTVRFQWSNMAQQFERVERGAATPLANHVTGVTFRYLDGNGVDTVVAADVLRLEAEIQVQRGETSTRVINSDVFLRNAVPAPGAVVPPPAPPPPWRPNPQFSFFVPPSPTVTATRTATVAPTRTATPRPTVAPTRTPTVAPSRTPTPAPTATRTATPTVTPLPR